MGWQDAPLLTGKTVAITGSASGIGRETARLCTRMGATVLGIDIVKSFDHVEELYRADLSDAATIDALLDVLPPGIDGLVNAAALPASAPGTAVLKVNLFAAKRLTLGLATTLSEGASIVNLGASEGADWPEWVEAIRDSTHADMDMPETFMTRHDLPEDGGRCHAFAAAALTAWTLQTAADWQGGGRRMNAVAPGPSREPEVVAPAIAFLLSGMAAGISGAILPTDGGLAAETLCRRHGLRA